MGNYKEKARRVMISILSVLVVFSLFLPGAAADNGEDSDTHKLAIMGTTDIHAHIMPYDYMDDAVDETIGLSKVYSVVEEIRAQYENTLLIDNVTIEMQNKICLMKDDCKKYGKMSNTSELKKVKKKWKSITKIILKTYGYDVFSSVIKYNGKKNAYYIIKKK